MTSVGFRWIRDISLSLDSFEVSCWFVNLVLPKPASAFSPFSGLDRPTKRHSYDGNAPDPERWRCSVVFWFEHTKSDMSSCWSDILGQFDMDSFLVNSLSN